MDYRDTQVLDKILDEKFDYINSYKTRYKGLIISVSDQSSLDFLVQVLKDKITNYQFVDFDSIYSKQTELPSRSKLVEKYINSKMDGVIFISPEDLMMEWSSLEKRAFWSSVSETYGRHVVIVVVLESKNLRKILSDYFSVKKIPSLSINIWISKYQQG